MSNEIDGMPFFIKDCVGTLDLLMQRAHSRDVRRIIERFRDAVNGSSMRTIPNVLDLEDRIREQVSRIERVVEVGDFDSLEKEAKHGIELVRERERQIMLYK